VPVSREWSSGRFQGTEKLTKFPFSETGPEGPGLEGRQVEMKSSLLAHYLFETGPEGPELED